MNQTWLDSTAESGLGEITPEQQREIRDRLTAESERPLTVAIMGQTGVGKSSLLNAAFGTNLQVGDVRPTTKIPEPVEAWKATAKGLASWRRAAMDRRCGGWVFIAVCLEGNPGMVRFIVTSG
jgi:predicted GTPase